MRIETAHKVLIASAVVFFAFYALFELSRWLHEGGAGALTRAGGGLAAAAALAVYLRSFARSVRRSRRSHHSDPQRRVE